MDNDSLLQLLDENRSRQYWIKPWGDPNQPVRDRENFADPDIRLMFAKYPGGVEIGDVLFVHRIKAAKLACVTRALTHPRELSPEEIAREPFLIRWPWRIEGENLTPRFGWWWRQCELKTFKLAEEYSSLNPNDHVNLGSLNHGNDKLRVLRVLQGF